MSCTDLLNFGVFLQSELVFVVQMGELLLCDVDTGARDEIDFALMQPLVEVCSYRIEGRRPNLARLVHQRHVEKLAVALLVRKSFHVAFLDDARLDRPVVLVWTEAFDRVNRAAVGAGSSRGLLLLNRWGSRSGGLLGRCGRSWCTGRCTRLWPKRDRIADFYVGVLDNVQRENDEKT